MDDSAQTGVVGTPSVTNQATAATQPSVPSAQPSVADQNIIQKDEKALQQMQAQTVPPAQDPFEPPVNDEKTPAAPPAMPPTVSGLSKEYAPMSTGMRYSEHAIPEDEEEDEPQITGGVAPAPVETEVSLSPELKDIGVETAANLEQPQLTDAQKQIGIEPAKEAVPVQAISSTPLQIPATKKEMNSFRHEHRWYEALRWRMEELFKVGHKLKRERI